MPPLVDHDQISFGDVFPMEKLWVLSLLHLTSFLIRVLSGFLSWFLAGKLKAFDRRGDVAKLCIVFLPLLCASLIAISRVDDYWHHWQDVFAGGFLGLVIASICYLQFFPPPYDVDGWFPHAYLHAMADSRHNDQPTTNPLQFRDGDCLCFI
ncbi:unnamed protein product [Musa hybrid cultivar]